MAFWCTVFLASFALVSCSHVSASKSPFFHTFNEDKIWVARGTTNASGLTEANFRRSFNNSRSGLELTWSLVKTFLPPATTTHVVLVRPNEEVPFFSENSELLQGIHSHGITTTVLDCSTSRVVAWALYHRWKLARHSVLLACPDDLVKEILDKVKQLFLESRFRQWLIFATDDIRTHLLPVVTESTRMILVYHSPDQSGLVATSALIGTNSHLRFGRRVHLSSDVGQIQRSVGLLFEDSKSMNSNLRGRELLVAHNNGMIFSKIRTVNGTDIFEGIDIQLLNVLARQHNFTYRLVLPQDRLWGGLYANGTVFGLIGMTAKGEVHLALDEITITENRMNVVDFTYPYYIDATCLISSSPRRLSPAFSIFRPFSPLVGSTEATVWMTILVAHLLVSVSGCCVGRLAARVRGFDHNNVSAFPSHHGWTTYFFGMFGALLGQSHTIKSKTVAISLVFISWYIACLLLNAAYSGLLIVVIWHPLFTRPIDSLADLHSAMADSKMTLLLTKGGHFDLLLSASKDEMFHDFNAVKQYAFLDDMWDFQVKNNGRIVRLYTKTSVMHKLCNDAETFHISRENFMPQIFGFAVPVAAPYRGPVSETLQRLVEGGLIQHIVQQNYREVHGCRTLNDRGKKSPSEALSFEHLQGAFILLGLGYLASLITLGAEKIF